jgi:hypothetical protein
MINFDFHVEMVTLYQYELKLKYSNIYAPQILIFI